MIRKPSRPRTQDRWLAPASRVSEDAGMRRFAGSFADFLAFEELDVVVRVELDDRLLPGARLAGADAAALGLRPHVHRANVDHAHPEDLLDRLARLRLVRARVAA